MIRVAQGDQNIIKFNIESDLDHLLNFTVAHELAHCVAYRLFGAKGHSLAWRAIMHTLGFKPEYYNKFKD